MRARLVPSLVWLLVVALIVAGAAAPQASAAAPAAGVDAVTADLDGKAIVVRDVGKYFCHDFDFPRIHCSADELKATANVEAALAATAVNYVQIFEHFSFAGAWMYVSQDYSVLTFIGWNDRISSFKALNSESGRFYEDWFYGGSIYNFCCNTIVTNLGSWDNRISSMLRT